MIFFSKKYCFSKKYFSRSNLKVAQENQTAVTHWMGENLSENKTLRVLESPYRYSISVRIDYINNRKTHSDGRAFKRNYRTREFDKNPKPPFLSVWNASILDSNFCKTTLSTGFQPATAPGFRFRSSASSENGDSVRSRSFLNVNLTVFNCNWTKRTSWSSLIIFKHLGTWKKDIFASYNRANRNPEGVQNCDVFNVKLKIIPEAPAVFEIRNPLLKPTDIYNSILSGSLFLCTVFQPAAPLPIRPCPGWISPGARVLFFQNRKTVKFLLHPPKFRFTRLQQANISFFHIPSCFKLL